MEILSIIPARSGSKSIPKKNIVKLDEKPLLYYTIHASKNSKYISRTIVSTNDPEITKIAKKFGAEVLRRPEKISGDKSSTEEAMINVLKQLKLKENYIPDVIILLQNTSPLRTRHHIDNALKLFFESKYDSILSVFRSHTLLWKKQRKFVIPINYNPKKRLPRQEMPIQYTENGAIFITKTELFNKTKCRISGKIGIYEMNLEDSVDINDKHDLFLVNAILKNKKK